MSMDISTDIRTPDAQTAGTQLDNDLSQYGFIPACFCPDGYFGSQDRHLYAASRWLSDLIDRDVDWPRAAAKLGKYMRSLNLSTDHIQNQVDRAEVLIAPWLVELKNNPKIQENNMSDMILPQDCLVVTATGEEAKLFRCKGRSLKADQHWTPQNLADEGPSGKSPPEQSDQESMEATFSKQVAQRLYDLGHSGGFDNLVLIADPNSLGEIRPLLHEEVTNKIILELDKTLINSPTSDIEKSIAAARN